jgi:hypothetical protein
MTQFDIRVRLALALWIAWAVVVWNVVFDHAIEIAGRAYLHSAAVAAQSGAPYARIEDVMRPGATTAFWTASGAAGVILAIGCAGLGFAGRRPHSVK